MARSDKRYRVPLKAPDGRVIAQAEVTETEDGLMFEASLASGPVTASVPDTPAMSFAFREPDPDLMSHDPLAARPPRVRREDALLF